MSGDPPSAEAVRGDKKTTQDTPRSFETGRGKTGEARLPFLPGLDGLRALAVIAVLLYHAGLAWLPGGFLGVEIFFVISGYLITALLLAEWRQRGRIDIKAFWMRRARRLLPALYLVLASTLAFALVFLPEEVAGLRGDALAAIGYVTNWYLVIAQESYFEAVDRPSLLRHLWSLAVEEQFYVLWPLLFFVGMKAVGWPFRRALVFVMLAGAAASAFLMAMLYQPELDPSRLYYGTDTRASGLLIGAALAFAWTPGRPIGQPQRWIGRAVSTLLNVAGLAALGGLVLSCIYLDETRSLLYRGGFAAVAVATAVAILVVADPRSRLLGTTVLGWGPLRWIGLRSYGIYLWHWPVFLVTRPDLDVALDGPPLLALRLAATVVLADLSYRFVETPIRTGALERAWRRLREAQGVRRWRLGAKWTGAIGTLVALSATLGVAVALAPTPAPPSYLSVESVHTTPVVADTETSVATSRASFTTPEITERPNEKAPEAAPEKATPSFASESPGRVTAVGDSVMVGAAGELERTVDNLVGIDAEIGLQAAGATEILRKQRDADQLGEVVVVHVGTNGTFNDEQFDALMRVLADARKVVVVNVKAARLWEQPNNAVLAEGVGRYPNAALVDWYAASADRPELFWEDGIHLRPEGAQLYADLISAQIDDDSG